MGLLDHLEEFRRRLFIGVGAWLLAAIGSYIFYKPILDLIRLPLDKGGKIGNVVVDDLYVPGIATAFILRIKVAIFAGIVLSAPVIFWEVFRFIAPGLRSREKKVAIPFFVASILLFLLGASIAYLILPTAINWLLGFVGQLEATPLIQFNEYVSFVTLMVLAFGVCFEVPLLLVALGAVGVVTSRWLRAKRAWAFLLAFIIGAVATPSGDPLSQTLMAAPLYLLYEVSILVIRFAFKK